MAITAPPEPVYFESGHTDQVHDIQFDYYGRRVATCSSDRTIKVFDTAGEQTIELSQLIGHDGPVWQVTWAHPKFGSLLASCSLDQKVIVWKEAQEAQWVQAYCSPIHTASVNGVAFAPHELGLMLAAASSDGTVSLLTYQNGPGWTAHKVPNAHPLGVTAVSWAPAAPAGSLVSAKGPGQPEIRFASSGADNTVKIWRYTQPSGDWQQDGATLVGHTDWVRDVAWAPNLGLPKNTIASAGQDGKVLIWTESKDVPGQWSPALLHDFKAPVWRVSWSITGGTLAVSDSQGTVTLWKEGLDGQWQQLSA
ncbi:hypothetical protein CVIRNUC_004086 [Coccomyxa viridis]|uniref:Uncharacterized protein n=1 Tax=Coccomyxa viridis TaxID=1274662 RepID=A0AAV1I222_9CHLO|nr:hypothetical protein CVIRNUC_004086 [Coccomyxa viridis]